MKKSLTFFILILGLAFSCKPKNEIILVEVPVLRASAIYNPDSVSAYIQAYSDKHKETANVYYEKSSEMKERNPEKAIYFMKRSITLQPRMSAYKELGTLLEQVGNYKEANDLYYFLTHSYTFPDNNTAKLIFQAPDLDSYYGYIITYLLENAEFPDWIMHEISEAELDQNEIKERLLKDERFKYQPSDLIYKNIMLQFMSDEEIEAYTHSEENFKNFTASIADTAGTFEIDEQQVRKFSYNNNDGDGEEGYRVSGLFYVYLKEKQDNTDGWYNYDYRHLIHLNDLVTAIVYAIDTSEAACPIEMRHIYHHLVTYDRKGGIIDSKIVAYQSGEEMATLKFNKNQFTVNQYKRTWKKPYVKADFDNDLLNKELIKEESYSITSDGKIVASSKEEESIN